MLYFFFILTDSKQIFNYCAGLPNHFILVLLEYTTSSEFSLMFNHESRVFFVSAFARSSITLNLGVPTSK